MVQYAASSKESAPYAVPPHCGVWRGDVQPLRVARERVPFTYWVVRLIKPEMKGTSSEKNQKSKCQWQVDGAVARGMGGKALRPYAAGICDWRHSGLTREGVRYVFCP